MIRDAIAEDAAAIAGIYNDRGVASTASWDLIEETVGQRADWLRARTAAGLPVLVAEADAVVVGWASYGPFRPKDGYARTMEHSVYVAEAATGGGHGAALMSELIERARTAGVHVLVGGLAGDNAASIAFHERFGFTEVGRMPQVGAKFGRWLDLVLMQLTLDQRPQP